MTPSPAITSSATPSATRTRVLDILSFLARFGLAAVWLASGWLKLSDELTTKQAIRAYRLFPLDIIPTLAVLIPAMELALGVLLLLGLFLRATSIVSAVIFVLFIAGIVSAWARGLTIDCGCFGGGGENPNAGPANYLTEIARDLAFIVMAGWTVWRPFTKAALHP